MKILRQNHAMKMKITGKICGCEATREARTKIMKVPLGDFEDEKGSLGRRKKLMLLCRQIEQSVQKEGIDRGADHFMVL